MRSQENGYASQAGALHTCSFAAQPLRRDHPAKRLLDGLPDFFAASAETGDLFATPQEILASGREARGHVRIAADKRVYIVRDGRDLPQTLPIRAAWQALFEQALGYLDAIEADTGWPRGTLASLVGGAAGLSDAPVETLMRLFCYTAHGADDNLCRLEPHVDRGLLTLVLGSTEGLGVMDARDGTWHTPAAHSRWRGKPMLSVLVGETLQYVSNKRFPACMHGVVAGAHTRYAVVFQLRPRGAAFIDSDALTTSQTGPYAPPIHEPVAVFETRRFAHARSVNNTE